MPQLRFVIRKQKICHQSYVLFVRFIDFLGVRLVCYRRIRLLLKVREAEILVVAIGSAKFVKGDWIKPGAVVIDCGINSYSGERK